MLKKLRTRITYANVTGTLALFVALATGGAYAANEWNGSNIQDGTLTGADIQDLSLGLPDYGANSISTGKLKDQDVRTQDLRDLGVTNSKINWDSISSGKVINNNLNDEDIGQGTFVGFTANIEIVPKHDCEEIPVFGVNAKQDHLLLTPDTLTSSANLVYTAKFTGADHMYISVCNPTAEDIDDNNTVFNLLVIDAQ
jgi:hypothetical protein